MKYFIIALLLPCFAFAQYQIDSTSNTNIGYVNNSTAKGNRVVAPADSPVNIPTSDCMGGVSAGGQGQYLGLSLGFSKQSKPCNIREFTKMLGYPLNPVQKALMCQEKMVKIAFDNIGEPCRQKPKNIKHEYPISKGSR